MAYLEDFLALFEDQRPKRAVWTADISYWISARQADGSADPAWATEHGYLEFCGDLRILPYYWYDRFWLAQEVYEDSVEIGVDHTGGVTTTVWNTPVGSITGEQTYLPSSYSTGHSRFPVQTVSDLEVLVWMMEHRDLREQCLDDYAERVEIWAEHGGVPAVALRRSPLASLMYEWAGVVNTSFLIQDAPDLVVRFFELSATQEEPILDAVCAARPRVVHFADNLSSDNMGGYYDELVAPGHRRRLERLQSVGVPCAVHLDGVVHPLLGKLAALGFDAVEAITPHPGGDLEIEEIRGAAGSDRVVLWGGVPGTLFAPPYAWQDMEVHVRRCVEAWRGSPYILGVADQVPPDGDISFCPRIASLLEEIA